MSARIEKTALLEVGGQVEIAGPFEGVGHLADEVRVGLRTREPRVGELESSKRPFVDKSDEIRPEERHISGTSPHEDSAIACLSEAFDSAFDRNAYDLSARHGHGLDPIAPYVSRFNCRLMDSILGRLIEPLPDYGPIVGHPRK
jgi:hypothetical protein